MRFRFLFALFLLLPSFASAAETPLPRTLIGLYDSRESSVRMTFMHRFLEMPTNHLGYTIQYYDVNAPLPEITDEIVGALIWFTPGSSVPDAEVYLSWLEKLVAANKKLIIIENAGINDKLREAAKTMERYNAILSHIGMQDRNQWNPITYRSRVLYMDNSIASFERPIGPILPPYGATYVIPGKAQSYLKILPFNQEEDQAVDLIITSPNGGYIAESYAIFHIVEDEESKIIQWFSNPFTFLQNALNTGFRPAPDVTTLNGKRIFYSHIDGDGWNNLCEIPEYAKNKTIVAEVLRKEVFAPYSDFVFTVGVIINELQPNCYGVAESEKAARDIYALPNIEPSSHTHSHPLYWRFFQNYSIDKEKPLLARYPVRPKAKSSLFENLKDKASGDGWSSASTGTAKTTGAEHPSYYPDKKSADAKEPRPDFENDQYETPRSYACSAFSLDEEIVGSIEKVNSLSPANKKARLIQWSGDTTPYEEALAKTREAGYLNINGGDSRFDNEYPSYSSVAPIGLQVGKERQIYSSNSNENTYTNLWTGRFFGFRYLQKTAENTETPIRVSPFNVYFHAYSGQKMASLLALKENLEYARKQNIIPIKTSHYAEIANSFYHVKMSQLAENKWKITNKGSLQTLRFDNALSKSINFVESEGVIGQNYFQGSLYIHLNPAINYAIISLKNITKDEKNKGITSPYLVESSWFIKDLQYVKDMLIITTQGFGDAKMQWQMPRSGSYKIQAFSNDAKQEIVFEKTMITDKEGLLIFTIPPKVINAELRITIEETRIN